MVQAGTILKVTDKTGVSLATCIKVLGLGKKRIAKLGDIILISVKSINLSRFTKLKGRQRKRFSKGTVHRALIIRTRCYFFKYYSVFLKFDENSIVLINNNVIPLSNRIYGPILRFFCIKYPSIGYISRHLI